jgi:hypothetical protein
MDKITLPQRCFKNNNGRSFQKKRYMESNKVENTCSDLVKVDLVDWQAVCRNVISLR